MRRGKFKSIKRVLYCTLPIFFLAKCVEGNSRDQLWNHLFWRSGTDTFRNIFPQIIFRQNRENFMRWMCLILRSIKINLLLHYLLLLNILTSSVIGRYFPSSHLSSYAGKKVTICGYKKSFQGKKTVFWDIRAKIVDYRIFYLLSDL